MARHILSKSSFIAGWQCPKRLFLQKFKPEVADEEDEKQAAVFQQGSDIGLLAQQLFDGGVNAQGDEEWHSSVTVERTQQLLPVHNIIYEAAFMHDGVLCALDILVRKGKKYYAFEVKGSTKTKDYHIMDAAVQYYIMSNCGIELADISILHLNSSYVRNGKLNLNELFTATSVLDQVIQKQEFVREKIQEFKNLLAVKVEPELAMGKQCNNPFPCNFQNYCSSLAPAVEEVTRVTRNKTEFQEYEVGAFLNGLQYPLYFMDFETVMYGVPQYDKSSPYQQIPFQYSIHVQDNPDDDTTHVAFLGDGITDPRRAFIEQLLSDLGTSGTILVWNITFEHQRLKELTRDFPEYAEPIMYVMQRMTDLMLPFKQKLIYNPLFNGSASLKAVLPVLIPHLSYQNLAIQEGGTASLTYSRLSEMNAVEQSEVRTQLLEYCHLDTLAMVEILARIRKG